MTNILNKKLVKRPKVPQYALVELLVEKSEYAECGVHKGDTGCVMEVWSREYIEVNFSGVTADGEYYGDCIVVKVDEVKIIK